MSKSKHIRRRKRGGESSSTNWYLIGGIVAVGVVALFALLFVSLQAQGQPTPTPQAQLGLQQYCEANPDRCVAKGDPQAPVTVVEVSDYGCGHCRNFNLNTAPVLDQSYVESGQVYWIAMPYALRPETQPPAAAALCAADQNAFFGFHEKMFEIQTTPTAGTRASFVQAAEDLGLNADEFASCIDSNRYNQTVQSNVLAARDAGVQATPTFFINGQKVEGNLPLANFQQQIDSMLNS